MKNLIISYTREHLISLRRILAEYELNLNKSPTKSHKTLIESITAGLTSSFYTKNFMVSKAELNHIFNVLQFRITTLNKESLLRQVPGIYDEVRFLIKPLEGLNRIRVNILYMLLKQH